MHSGRNCWLSRHPDIFSASNVLSFERSSFEVSQLRAFSASSGLSFKRSQLQAFLASSVLSFKRSHIWMSAQVTISSAVNWSFFKHPDATLARENHPTLSTFLFKYSMPIHSGSQVKRKIHRIQQSNCFTSGKIQARRWSLPEIRGLSSGTGKCGAAPENSSDCLRSAWNFQSTHDSNEKILEENVPF